MAKLERTFALDHPAAQGHFPGNPLIPGAVLLSETVQAVGAALSVDMPQCRIQSVKFVSPVRPGDRVSIEFSVSAEGRAEFVCFVAEQKVMTGMLWPAPRD